MDPEVHQYPTEMLAQAPVGAYEWMLSKAAKTIARKPDRTV